MNKIDKYLNKIYFNNKGDEFRIEEYINSENVTVKFNDGTIKKHVTMHNIKRGAVKNLYKKEILNVAFSGDGAYSWTKDRLAYSKWKGILERSYSENFTNKYPTYKDVTVCEEWHNFQNFAKWFYDNYNPEIMQGWHLDKDILVKGNKIYSPETCAFVPLEINLLFLKNKSTRGKQPIGVKLTKSLKFLARIKISNNCEKNLGRYNTPEEAFQAYKTAKEEYIKEIADKWKDKIDPRVYEAMYNYQVEITD